MSLPASFRKLLLTSLLISWFAVSVQGEILHLKVPGTALADSNRTIIATPTDFDPNRTAGYPFIIMLHGWSGDETQWQDDADLQFLSDKYTVLLVLPDGGYDGWWVDTDLQPGRNYSTHIRQELKTWIINQFNGSADFSQQGILGLSMGGYGAILQALNHPQEYAAAASLSGIMDISHHTDNWCLSTALGTYSAGSRTWATHNPIELLKPQGLGESPALLLICGRDDFAFPENQDMAFKLKTLGYSIDFRAETGTHSHVFWQTHVESAIAFIVTHFSGE